MTIVKLENDFYGEVTAKASDFIQFNMFVVQDAHGDTWPVTKDTCKVLDCYETEDL